MKAINPKGINLLERKSFVIDIRKFEDFCKQEIIMDINYIKNHLKTHCKIHN